MLSVDGTTILGLVLRSCALGWFLAGTFISAYLLEVKFYRVINMFLGLMLLIIPICYLIFTTPALVVIPDLLSTMIYVAYIIIMCIVGALPAIIVVIATLIMGLLSLLGLSIGDSISLVYFFAAIIPAIAEGIVVGRWIYFHLGVGGGPDAVVYDENGNRKDVYF